MSATILDGKAVAQRVLQQLATRVDALKARGVAPRLAVVRVGDDPASKVYIRAKIRACEQIGVLGGEFELPGSATEADVLQRIAGLNADASVHGILVQLPLPAGIRPHRISDHIVPHKDVDGLHALNFGRLLQGEEGFRPCTPAGIVRLLDEYGIEPRGKHVVIVGRSEIVGKPIALLLLERDATVTVCHSRTPDLGAMTRLADIVVVAVGRPHLLKAEMVRPGAVVIDVGVNRLPDGNLAGDADYAAIAPGAAYITPVPGGVGPMTVAMLIQNTVMAAERQATSVLS
jgi:methylenetetrahydrofolate dehydrogenase (NADP+) / methenyltetrahydrofolate cyclohydrolase